MKRLIKRCISGLLIVSMASAVLTPVMPVYAAGITTGDEVKIVFDTMDGPETILAGNVMNGRAGTPLSASGYYDWLPQYSEDGGPERPALEGLLQDDEWEGYLFSGWYKENDEELTKLPYAFEYEAVTTYQARWVGDSNVSYSFVTNHEIKARDINDEDVLISLFDGEETISSPVGSTITTQYKRTIPGYQYIDKKKEPEYRRKYGESAGMGTGQEIGKFHDTNNSFAGMMPNEDMTITYTYEPDPTRKFLFTAEYMVREEDGSLRRIAASTTERYHAEEAIESEPKEIVGYINPAGTIIAGDTEDSGIYSITRLGYHFNSANGKFTGKMPNQAVTIQYVYEEDPDYVVGINVSYVDGNGTDMMDYFQTDLPVFYEAEADVETIIPMPNIPGYLSDKTIRVSEGSITSMRKVSEESLGVTPNQQSCSIVVEYVLDSNDEEWSRVAYQSGTNGRLIGNSSPESFVPGEYNIEDIIDRKLAGGMEIKAEDYYLFDGWYLLDAAGNRIGERLETLTLAAGQTVSIEAYFVENPSQWHDITFRAGSNGTITYLGRQKVSEGTAWSSIMIPSCYPNSGYVFDKWVDSQGNPVDEVSTTFNATMEYTAIFKLIDNGSGNEDILTAPEAQGQIGDDGRGEISISDIWETRRYALTDDSGTIIGVLTGIQISTGSKFTGLNPSSRYEVYELASSVQVTPGLSISIVDDELKSAATTVKIFALGDNYQVDRDSEESGAAGKITINPAAANTAYGIMDEAGNVISQPAGDAQGWVLPAGNTNVVTLTGLESGQIYTVVAKSDNENITPQQKQSLGSQVYVYFQVSQEDDYWLEVIDGRISRIGDDLVNETAGIVRSGTSIRIEAELFNDSGNSFSHWEVLIGNIDGFNATSQTHPTPGFVMPEGNVVLAAIYDRSGSGVATASNASLEYTVNSGHEGEVAIDLSEANELRLLDSMLTAEDEDLMINQNQEITYRIRLNKRSASSAERNLISNEINEHEDAFRAAWALDTSLLRYVNGNRRDISDDCEPDSFDILIQIDQRYRNMMDYQIWELDEDGNAELLSVSPDPNDSPEYQGIFRFTGEIDKTYVLTYSLTYQVQLVNMVNRNIVESMRVRSGEGLESSEDFSNWTPLAEIPDTSNEIWYYQGLSTSPTTYREYDITAPVTRNREIYAYYTSSDLDAEEARKNLEETIRDAEELMNDSKTSETDRKKLEDTIKEAEELLNTWPRVPVEELNKKTDELKNLIEKVKKNNNGNTGGNNNGSGGGSGGSSSSSSKTPIKVGLDGQWQMIDADKHQWIFVLNDGTRLKSRWAYLSYINNGISNTYYYYFQEDGTMASGWFMDGDGQWYYLSTVHDGWFGRMVTGWHYDENDKRQYYLDPESGALFTGWRQIDNQWYYFTNYNRENTYHYNTETKQWMYNGSQEWPWGSLLTDGITPDGYRVDAKGIWQNR